MRSIIILAACLMALPVCAQGLFFDDFEVDLSKWTGKGGGLHNGIIVDDPLNPANHCLTFTSCNNSGDVFGLEVQVQEGDVYVLRFDYLGLELPGSEPGNLGGLLGISEDTPGLHRWLAGTTPDNNVVLELLDDGVWHSYAIEVDPYETFTPSNNTIRVMLEDWDSAGLPPPLPPVVPGDAFFDNVSVELGPISKEPGSWGRIKRLYR